MQNAFRTQSPRLHPRPAGWASVAVGIVPLVVYPWLVVQAFVATGVAGWAVGVVYILYDTFLLGFTAVAIRGLRAGPAAAGDGAGPTLGVPTLGVIVAARNEAAVLAVTIDRLAAQARPPELILLADDGSDDGSAAVLVERYGLVAPEVGALSGASPVLPSLRWLRLAHGGKARALNAALLHVDCEVVLTVDADVRRRIKSRSNGIAKKIIDTTIF